MQNKIYRKIQNKISAGPIGTQHSSKWILFLTIIFAIQCTIKFEMGTYFLICKKYIPSYRLKRIIFTD